MVKLLQVCNVGNIVGGTAACAWTVTQALPRWKHRVAFLSRITDETRRAFSQCMVEQWERVTAKQVAASGADVVLLHNTGRDRAEWPLPAATVAYVHSRIDPAPADATWFCSQWLAGEMGRQDSGFRSQGSRRNYPESRMLTPESSFAVLYQAVPRPKRLRDGDDRSLRETLVIGRICTPQRKKWPVGVVRFCQRLAARFPQVRWEFVGCPAELQDELRSVCGGRAAFFPASWDVRSRLWEWDALLYHNSSVTESFGRTCAEAMRAGCVPIVDRRGGFIEQVPPECGFLCEAEADFAAAVERLLDPVERCRRSIACREWGDERFSLRKFGEEIVARLEGIARSCAVS